MAVKQRREVSQAQLATITAAVDYADRSENAASPDHAEKGESSEVPADSILPLTSLALVSMVAAGIQFGWALQLSLLTPYIQTLGIEHAFSSFIWLCGPVTGLVVQPCIGVWSDKCRSKYGRRRPFILAGALLVIVSVILIGYAADIGFLLGDTHDDCHVYKGSRPRAAFVFVIGFWLLDLANNTVQGPTRALLADLSGSEQRDTANAIFVLWMALGNILGFATGAIGQWYKLFPFLTSKPCCEACGNLKAAFFLAVIFLTICTVVTLIFAQETPLASNHIDDSSPLLHEDVKAPDRGPSIIKAISTDTRQADHFDSKPNAAPVNEERQDTEMAQDLADERLPYDDESISPGAVLVNILLGVRQLPPSMKIVLLVMAFCWLSWFPFFLFDTDWMGREVFHGDPQGDAASIAAYQDGVRVGSLGLLLNSVVLGISSFFIDPLCRWIGSKYVWAISNFMVFLCMASTTIITACSVDTVTINGLRTYVHPPWVKVAAVALFTVLGLPLSITYSVPYSITAELTAESGGGQGLAMGILNLAVVLPQIVVALGAGPWDALFGGGNEPAFALASIFALVACVVAAIRLPQLSRNGYRSAVAHFG